MSPEAITRFLDNLRIERQQRLGGGVDLATYDLSAPEQQSRELRAAAISSAAELAIRAAQELAIRRREAGNIYQPLPGALDFHKSTAKTRILRAGNQAGKTVAAAAEVAWILTGRHPYQTRFPKKNGIFYCVGFDEKHIRELMWPKLARSGAFRIIKDEITGKWRPFNANNPYDAAYREKTREAEPFIPHRFIAKISWLSKKDDCPHSVVLKNGWRCNFYSSKAAPQQGTQINGGWIDEEIEREKWYSELVARCIVRSGSVIWSATPLANTQTLYRLHQRARQPAGIGEPCDITEHVLSIDQNIYLTDKQRSAFKAELSSDEVRVRYFGEFAVAGLVVYPEFSRSIHCVNDFTIPETWSRWMIVDPGVQVCAVLFAAVPPSNEEIHIYRELYIRRASAKIFAETVAASLGEYKTRMEGFIIDMMMARQSDLGIGRTILQQYSEELERVGVRSRTTGYGFIPGSTDTVGREQALRSWLEINPKTRQPYIRIHKNACPVFCWELDNQFYVKPKDGRNIDERKRIRKNDHLVTCAEYLAAFDPQYTAPEYSRAESAISKRLREKAAKKSRRYGEEAISLGPPL